MSITHPLSFVRGRRAAAAIAAGAVALAVAGSGVAVAAVSGNPAPSGKITTPAKTTPLSPHGIVSGTTVTLGPDGYGSATVTCPVDTEIFGGGESNNAPGTLVLTDSFPTSNTTWRVYVKNTSASTYVFTPYAVCR
jgi:hypothetical protein